MKLVILNYNTGITTIVDPPKSKTKDIDYSETVNNYLIKNDFKVSDCEWMLSNKIEMI